MEERERKKEDGRTNKRKVYGRENGTENERERKKNIDNLGQKISRFHV